MTVPGAGQEPNPAAGQVPAGAATTTSTQTTPAAGQEPAAAAQGETFTREYVEQLRRENADHRTRATTAETKVAAHERAALSETERTAAELADLKTKNSILETQYQTSLVQTAIEREAMKLGAVDSDVVFALVDRTTVKIADGVVTGAEAAVAALLKAKPYLVKADGTTGTKSVPATGKPGAPAGKAELIETTKKELRSSGLVPF